ncbi:MAG: toxic anion resistance protein, partial [Oscillospiraceae bacterium]
MALNFTPSDQLQADTSANIVETKVVEEETAQRNIKVAEPQNFSMVETSNNLKNELVKNDEINKLVATININDTNSIVKFGSEAADDISKASDQVLNSMNMDQINDTGALLTALANIMEKFDAAELEKEEKKGFFNNLKKQIDKILDKYTTMGNDVDKTYVQLKQYES